MPPSIRHEAVVEVLRSDPQVLALLLTGMGVRLPSRAIPDIGDAGLSSRDPALLKTLIADNVFVFRGVPRKLAVVFEVQASRPDRSRSLAWPAYLAVARAVHGCDAVLCVMGLTSAAVRDSRKVIRTGHPGFDLAPRVTGCHMIPLFPDPARGPGLVVLNVMTRDLDLNSHEARMLALAILASAPPQRRALYTRYIRAVVPQPVRKALEDLMKTTIKDTFMDSLIAEGLEKGLKQGLEQGKAIEGARFLLRYLTTQFEVPADIHDRITACEDTAQLEAWFDRAIAAATIDEVFAD
jgi:hypothetical protein